MIRELTIGDFEKVEPMMAALHKIHVENRSDFYSENAHPITKKEFKAMLKDKNKIALTFAENGEIAGIALATIKDRGSTIRRTARRFTKMKRRWTPLRTNWRPTWSRSAVCS